MTSKIYLPVVDGPEEGDATLVYDGPKDQPILQGDNREESLACGNCKRVIVKHMSTSDVFNGISSTSGRLLLRCNCQAYNALKVTKSGAG